MDPDGIYWHHSRMKSYPQVCQVRWFYVQAFFVTSKLSSIPALASAAFTAASSDHTGPKDQSHICDIETFKNIAFVW